MRGKYRERDVARVSCKSRCRNGNSAATAGQFKVLEMEGQESKNEEVSGSTYAAECPEIFFGE
jgi:hypothetical protein